MTSTPPILEITDGKGKLLPSAPFIVLATMFHADNPQQRRQFLETLSAKVLIEIGAPIPQEQANQAAATAAEIDSVIDRASYAGYGMAVSGDLLLFIINAALYSPNDASLARTIRVWCEDHALGRTHEGRAVAASPRSVKAAWSRFKPVAHLCGAWRLSQIDRILEWNPTDPEKLLNFLAIAEGLREFGEAHHPPSGRTGSQPSRTSTLDPETTWKVPPDLALPSRVFFVPPLTEYAQGVLRNYRAE
jgi:hypothetical protein